ncbi:MAG: gliding motility-associated C-terminal domain-containing protein [Bacteroidetes bacterium]|nr:gliding motility-associated C-terminal domain-containing protein [Bacteroidota bacterium]
MIKRSIVLAGVILITCFSSFATHIVGGELCYEYLGGNNYKIILKVYRDCNTGNAPYDSPACVSVFSSSGTLLDTLKLALPPTNVIVTPPSPCFVPPSNVCVEGAIYTITVNFPPRAGGYDLVYQRCCRNSTILNLINPGLVGSSYIAHIPDQSTFAVNSNPRYKNFPPVFLCARQPIKFDHSASDLDGDSLVYELCDPFVGATACCPVFGPAKPTAANSTCPAPPSSCPKIPDAPPYNFVPWKAPYNAQYPMSALPALSIDPSTGLLTGTPNMIGQWVVGVCVNEYRNGILIGKHNRDFQFNVINCVGLATVSIPAQSSVCAGKTITFQNNTTNASKYHWDFGVNGSSTDTSNLVTPTFTFPDTGKYTITLIANPGSGCADTGKTTISVYDPINASYTVPSGQCLSGNSFNFNAAGNLTAKAVYSWTFGTNASPSVSSIVNPSGIRYNAAGTYAVKLSVTDNTCSVTLIDTIKVFAPVEASIPIQTPLCNGKVITFQNTTINGSRYLWDFGVNGTGTDTSGLYSPTYTYTDTGMYTISLIAKSGNACPDDTAKTMVKIYGPLNLNYVIPQGQCIQGNNFNFNLSGSLSGKATYAWSFGSGATPPASTSKNPTGIRYSTVGTYPVTISVSDIGCNAVHADTVRVYGMPQAQFTYTPKPACPPFELQFTDNSTHNSNGTLSYVWKFGDGTTSAIQNPVHYYASGTNIHGYLIVSTDKGCKDSIDFHLSDSLCNIRIPNIITPNGDGKNDKFYVENLEYYAGSKLVIYNRWGRIVYENGSYVNDWDGNGVSDGTYYFILYVSDGRKFPGFLTILR